MVHLKLLFVLYIVLSDSTFWERASLMALLCVMFLVFFYHFPTWCPGSGVVFDCMDS